MTVEPASRSAVFTIRQWGAVIAGYGLLTIIGGPDRWGAPPYRFLNWIPGSCYTVGALMLAAGTGVLVGSFAGRYRLRDGAMFVAMIFCVCLSAAFLVAGVADRHASLAGWLLFAGLALQFRVLRRLRSRPPT